MADDGILAVREGIDVEGRAAELGLDPPEAFALLPFNFAGAESADELMAVDQADVIRRMVLPGLDAAETPVEGDRALTRANQRWDGHLYLPTVHFSREFLDGSWDEAVALVELLAEHYREQAEELPGVPEDTAVEVSFNCELDGGSVQIVFEDHPAELDRVVGVMADELGREVP